MSIAIPPDEHEIDESIQIDPTFAKWRLVHRTASFGIGLMALVHLVSSVFILEAWSPDAVWFLGTGLGLLLLAVMNLAHVGLGPCRMPTAPAVRAADWVFAAFGAAALTAVPEPQAIAIAGLLVLQAIASHRTLLGSA